MDWVEKGDSRISSNMTGLMPLVLTFQNMGEKGNTHSPHTLSSSSVCRHTYTFLVEKKN